MSCHTSCLLTRTLTAFRRGGWYTGIPGTRARTPLVVIDGISGTTAPPYLPSQLQKAASEETASRLKTTLSCATALDGFRILRYQEVLKPNVAVCLDIHDTEPAPDVLNKGRTTKTS